MLHRWLSSHILLLVVLVLGASGCTVRLIGSYDEQIDKSVTALQQKVDTFLVKLAGEHSPECTYEQHKQFYEEATVDLSGIKVRAEAIPNNSITVQQIDLLASSLNDIEKLHQLKSAKPAGKNCLSAEEIEPIRQSMNTSFTAILKLELAKKRGDVK